MPDSSVAYDLLLLATIPMPLLSLPDDLLVLILQHCSLTDIFQVPRVCRRLATVTRDYVKTIAPAVAATSFPKSDFFLLPGSNGRDWDWLKLLVPKFMAAVLLDRYSLLSHTVLGQYLGIPPEDTAGDEIRGRITRGLVVMNRLSRISKDVYSMRDDILPQIAAKGSPDGPEPDREAASCTPELSVLRSREELVLKRRLDYCATLDEEDISCYHLMYAFLCACIRSTSDRPSSMRWLRGRRRGVRGLRGLTKSPREPHYFDWFGGGDMKLLQAGDSWVNWALLRYGPMIFWRQWYYGDDKDVVKNRLLGAWASRSTYQRGIETAFGQELDKSLESTKAFFGYAFLPLHIISELEKHSRMRQERKQSAVTGALRDVPYWVDFRT
ncbi:hypothetical protein SCUP234_06727 [Seiridium cupressi]